MSEGIVAEVADRLRQAEIDRSPISPITDTHPELVIEDAYAIQSRNIAEEEHGQPAHERPHQQAQAAGRA